MAKSEAEKSKSGDWPDWPGVKFKKGDMLGRVSFLMTRDWEENDRDFYLVLGIGWDKNGETFYKMIGDNGQIERRYRFYIEEFYAHIDEVPDG